MKRKKNRFKIVIARNMMNKLNPTNNYMQGTCFGDKVGCLFLRAITTTPSEIISYPLVALSKIQPQQERDARSGLGSLV